MHDTAPLRIIPGDIGQDLQKAFGNKPLSIFVRAA
jgi:hypothetical protein